MTRLLCRTTLAFLLCAGFLVSGASANSRDVAEYNDLGIRAYESGQFEEAVGHFRSAYGRSRNSNTIQRNLTNALQALANEHARTNDFGSAIDLLQDAIDIAPANPGPYIQSGAYLLRENRVSDAIFRLEEAIELKPGDLEAHELLGRAYYEDNDLPSARAQWDYVARSRSLAQRAGQAL